MNILYFGKIVDHELHVKDETVRKNPYQIAQYSYEKAFCDKMCQKANMTIMSIYQMDNFPKNKLFFKRKKQSFQNTKIKYIPYINLPFMKEICFLVFTCVNILIWKIKNRKVNQKYIYANTHYPPVSLGIVLMGKLLKVKKIITFTDISLFTYSKEKISKMPFYKKIVIKPYVKLVNKLQESYDLYVLFSKPMNDIVNKHNKPYLVMEGIYNPDKIDLKNLNKKKAIAHAGTLNKEVGIETILNVFEKIEDNEIELWLIGKGDMDEEIQKRAKQDKRIKFLGFQPKEKVFEYLKQARLLINLRNPNDIYTKYSFPSKTFEYMVSGTPFLTTKLEGIPKEYYRYIYTIENFNQKDIINKIEFILNKEEKELNKFGEKAREFILNHKNAEQQINKIVSFIIEKGGNT